MYAARLWRSTEKGFATSVLFEKITIIIDTARRHCVSIQREYCETPKSVLVAIYIAQFNASRSVLLRYENVRNELINVYYTRYRVRYTRILRQELVILYLRIIYYNTIQV